jgi:secreted trypsin-like serine protease
VLIGDLVNKIEQLESRLEIAQEQASSDISRMQEQASSDIGRVQEQASSDISQAQELAAQECKIRETCLVNVLVDAFAHLELPRTDTDISETLQKPTSSDATSLDVAVDELRHQLAIQKVARDEAEAHDFDTVAGFLKQRLEQVADFKAAAKAQEQEDAMTSAVCQDAKRVLLKVQAQMTEFKAKSDYWRGRCMALEGTSGMPPPSLMRGAQPRLGPGAPQRRPRDEE